MNCDRIESYHYVYNFSAVVNSSEKYSGSPGTSRDIYSEGAEFEFHHKIESLLSKCETC